MKTIKDIQDYCYEQEQYAMDRLLSNLDGDTCDGNPTTIADLQFWNGQIKAFEEVAQMIRNNLKNHACDAGLDNQCVLCGEFVEDEPA